MTPPSADPIEVLRRALAGQYTVERLLGQGGMGSVYLARDLTLDRPVAIKVVSPEVAGSATVRSRFLQEARVVANLRHPNIVAVYAAGEAAGQLYFAMECVPGESLRERLTREGALAPELAQRVLGELALALDYAHAQGVIHRDVKPENILLDRDTGRAMLTDFGIARAFDRDGSLTGSGVVLGSPRYISPEQASGERTLDGRSDLYSLALVGYEMVTGRSVVDASNAAAMIVKHLTDTPAPMRVAAPGVTDGYAAAVDRGLVKHPEARWATGREMAEAIGLLTPVAGLGGTTGSQRTSRRRRRRAAGLALLAAVAVAGAAFWWRGHATASRFSYVVVPFTIQSGNADVQWLHDGAVNMLTLSLAQWRDLAVTDYERTLDLVRASGITDAGRVSLDDARTVARRANAGSLVMGQVSTTGDSTIVVARLYDATTGKLVNDVTRATALGADPRPVFDEIARYLLDVSGGVAAATVDLAKATTTSVVAYREYLDGIHALNGWQLELADSLFAAAIARDSTFALAYHKRAVARGWSDISGTEYARSAELALVYAGRLPPRERAVVEGHGMLARGLDRLRRGDSTARSALLESAAIYERLVADAPTIAEAWYGLGDANWHVRQVIPFSQHPAVISRARVAFERALAVDPEMHLAYSHLVDLYTQMGTGDNGLALLGDSVVPTATVKDPARLSTARARAFDRAVAAASDWLRSDPTATQPYSQLAQALVLVHRPDSAARVLRAGARKVIDGSGATLPIVAALYDFLAGSATVGVTLGHALDSANIDQFRRRPVGTRTQALGLAVSLAAAAGDSRLLDRAARFWVAVDSVIPGTAIPFAPYARWYVTVMRVSMGEPVSPAIHTALLDGARAFEQAGPERTGPLRGNGIIPSAYAAFLATGDTTFAGIVKRLSTNSRMIELDAARALATGDTAAARRIASAFPSPDSVRHSNLGMAGMRTVARAGAIEQLGDPRTAAGQLDALSTARMQIGFIEPGFARFVRSYLDRGRLYEQLGERAKALAAYEEFLRLWAVDDPVTARERRAAREGVNRLRDTKR